MNFMAIAIPALLFATIGLPTWLWFAMVRVNEELSGFSDFEGMHFEVSTTE